MECLRRNFPNDTNIIKKKGKNKGRDKEKNKENV